jgi:membrane-associated phospholipid phosphatase
VHSVWSSEWIAFSYFLYLAVVSWLRPLPLPRRLTVTSVSVGLLLIIWIGAITFSPSIRNWAPFAYVAAGYYLPGWLFVRPAIGLEAWLLAWDRRLLGDPTTRFSAWPAWLVGYFEISYTLCFLLLPAGFAALALTGRTALANHYWTMVLAADLAAFAPVSVVQTRPPWAIERAPALADQSVHRFASFVVRTATIRVNTFPSGHVAVSFAIAAALMTAMPVAAAICFVVAVSISVACVVGRYHYVVDVFSGVALAVVVWMTVAVCGL